MDFIYLFRVLFKRKWIIIGSALLAAGVAYFFTRHEPKQYKSNSQISTGFAINEEIRVNDNVSFLDADTKFNNVIVTALSPSVLSLLSYTLILHDLTNPNPFRRLSVAQKQSPLFKEINMDEAIRTYTDKLETMTVLTSYKPEEKKLLELLGTYGYSYQSIGHDLNIYRLQRTDYLQIDYQSENPELSAFVVNEVFKQFLRYYKNVRRGKSQESIDTLQSMMEKKKQELDSKNALLRGEGLVDVNIESTSKFDLISQLEQKLTDEKDKQTKLDYNLRKLDQRLAKLGVATSTTPAASTTNPADINRNEEIFRARRAMNDAYDAYLNTGSTDKALLNKYNQLKAEYQNKIVNAPISSGTSGSSSGSSGTSESEKNDLLEKKSDIMVDIQASDVTIKAIQTKIDGLRGTVVQDASKGAIVETIQKEVDLANKEYLAAKQKFNDAIDINTSNINNFHQILVGQPAINPEPSKRGLIVAMSGMVALVTTILVIILLTYLDSSIKTPAIFGRIVHLKLISMINFMNMHDRSLEDLTSNVEVNERNADEQHRGNIFRESLRKLRYEIENSGKKIFLFTSTKKGEGKSTIIQALSYSMSMSKKKILIIDTNFCNNDLTVRMNASPILEKIIPSQNGQTLVDQVKALSKDTGTGSVFVIGSQGGDYTPSEILPRENLLQYLQSLTSFFDFIFLEGPPLNDFSDSKELAQYVDGIIAVFSATKAIKQIDVQSIEFFHSLNGKFTGSVLNMVDPKNINTI